jgi:hypothetical protein
MATRNRVAWASARLRSKKGPKLDALTVYLSMCVRVCVCLSACLSICRSICLSFCLSACTCVCVGGWLGGWVCKISAGVTFIDPFRKVKPVAGEEGERPWLAQEAPLAGRALVREQIYIERYTLVPAQSESE